MATVNLGSLRFDWKGAYNGSTAYVKDDVVSYNGSSYIAKTATTGNLPTVTANWDIMSQAGTNGTNGTDVGTTITTQGDLLYRDGSGLQRLAAGTSGQFLKTQGAGANPVWGTVSSEMVRLAKVTTSSSASSVDFNGYFDDTTYYHYLMRARVRVAANAQVRMRWLTAANTPYTTSNYRGGHNYSYRHNNSNTDGRGLWFGSNEQDHMKFSDWAQKDSRDFFITSEFSKPTASMRQGVLLHQSNGNDSGTYFIGGSPTTWEVDNAQAWTGIRLYTNTSNFVDGCEFILYGFKA